MFYWEQEDHDLYIDIPNQELDPLLWCGLDTWISEWSEA